MPVPAPECAAWATAVALPERSTKWRQGGDLIPRFLQQRSPRDDIPVRRPAHGILPDHVDALQAVDRSVQCQDRRITVSYWE
jgi:hypothetical protein